MVRRLALVEDQLSAAREASDVTGRLAELQTALALESGHDLR
jgi:hypothetical protein